MYDEQIRFVPGEITLHINEGSEVVSYEATASKTIIGDIDRRTDKVDMIIHIDKMSEYSRKQRVWTIPFGGSVRIEGNIPFKEQE